jgi:glycosyltransferase involved in cell wall biosynthesis
VFKPLSKVEARAKLGLPLHTRIILFVGNLVEMKGVQFLLEAVASLQLENTKLVLVGDGELRDALLAHAERLGITPMCSFVGKRPHHEIACWLSAADCLVLPSTSEGLPTILPEAMLCRTPIVATTVGGIPEIIDNARNGLLVPPMDAHALTDALRSLLGDQENASRMATEAQSDARRSLTWEANARELCRIYEHAAHAA